jgi:hypothetical protein
MKLAPPSAPVGSGVASAPASFYETDVPCTKNGVFYQGFQEKDFRITPGARRQLPQLSCET